MCGVAGIYSPEGVGPEHVVRTTAMIRTLRHRGPDGFSVVTLDTAVIAHARLAIIDLTTGDQPVGNEDGSVQVILNGEIYNYVELRAELLARGHTFRTHSDTEVVAHLYEEVGDRCLDRLRGMFVIVIHDAKRRRFILARDRLGKKPLYWARTPLGVCYASEPRALLALEDVDRSVDLEALNHFLTWQYVPAPWSIYRGIRKVPAATAVVFDETGEHVREFWDACPGDLDPLSSDEAAARLRDTLATACRIRLRSDVPLGTFLSGGIDSGLVAAYSARAMSEPLRAVTIGFGTPADETGLARASARKIGLALTERRLDIDVAAAATEVLDFMDEPHGDSSCLPTWLVCKVAREQVTVALSGDGGDESFGGYAARYSEQLALEGMRSWMPTAIRSPVFGTLGRLWPRDARLPRSLRLAKPLASLARDSFEAWAHDRSILAPPELAAWSTPAFKTASKDFSPHETLRSRWDRCAGAPALERLLYMDRHSYMTEGVVAKVDRMSMAHSLEVRSPLLDHEVVELSLRVRQEDKVAGGVGKRILRRLAAEVLPPEVTSAPKSGFAPPIVAWLRGPLKALVQERLLAPDAATSAVLDPSVTRRIVDEHHSGRRDHSQKLWSLLALESWARRFAGGRLLP